MVEQIKYITLDGEEVSLAELDAEERALLQQIREHAAGRSDWTAFASFWTRAVAAFYDGRGVTRRESRRSPIYQIAQDMQDRLAIAHGEIRQGDYRDELEELIHTRFRSQREFCQATGISEDVLSHVLAGRKHLAVDTLEAALARIGYRVRFTRLELAAEHAESVTLT